MPYALRKLPGQEKWKVYNTKSKHVYMKAGTKRNAQRQIRLLRMREVQKNGKKM